jgi:hypothetical protein
VAGDHKLLFELVLVKDAKGAKTVIRDQRDKRRETHPEKPRYSVDFYRRPLLS